MDWNLFYYRNKLERILLKEWIETGFAMELNEKGFKIEFKRVLSKDLICMN